MTELAAHVRDIDIYHTDEDRDEYNNGLFWHTDHYIDVATATHRTFSREHLKIKNPMFCGGGPATEHCYTTGLMYHYYLTGDVASREAALGLSDWSIKVSDPPITFMGLLYSYKRMLPIWKKVFSGGQELVHKYPLNRGTGNSIVACIDAFELSGDHSYLRRAEDFISGCVHPDDNIDSRDLLNAESNWSYTVFFSAVGKFLDKKIEIGEIDRIYEYARISLLNYAKWMFDNEYPFLDKPELLEFPTETWPAQDMRKSCVFYYAACHSDGSARAQFVERAEFFFNNSMENLMTYPTKTLTRPLALLLQNGWVSACLENNDYNVDYALTDKYDFGSSPMLMTKRGVIKRIFSDFFSALKRTSINKELDWIRTRLRTINK